MHFENCPDINGFLKLGHILWLMAAPTDLLLSAMSHTIETFKTFICILIYVFHLIIACQ